MPFAGIGNAHKRQSQVWNSLWNPWIALLSQPLSCVTLGNQWTLCVSVSSFQNGATWRVLELLQELSEVDDLICISSWISTWHAANNLVALAIIRSVGWEIWSHYFFKHFSVLQNHTSIKLLEAVPHLTDARFLFLSLFSLCFLLGSVCWCSHTFINHLPLTPPRVASRTL